MSTLEWNRFYLYAREDFFDTIRGRQAHVVLGCYLIFVVLFSYQMLQSPAGAGDRSSIEFLPLLYPILVFVTPLLAIGMFSASIASKRESGSLTVILGLPISRPTVICGTVLARSFLLSVAIFCSVGVAVLIGFLFGVSIEPGHVVGGIVFLLVLGIVFTSIAIMLSALINSVMGAMLIALLAWAAFVFQLWNYLPLGAVYLRNGFSIPPDMPYWFDAIVALNPMVAFSNLVDGTYPVLESGMSVSQSMSSHVFAQPLIAMGILCGWVIVTLWIANRHFSRIDL